MVKKYSIDETGWQQQCLFPVPYEQLKTELGIFIKAEIEAIIKALAIEERMLSAEQACNLFYPQITPQTLRTWVSKGHVKSYTLGGKTLYKQSEVIASATTLKKYRRTEKPGTQNNDTTL